MSRLLVLTTALSLSACSYKVDKAPEDPSGTLQGSLGFSQVQTSILGPKCSRCHGWISSYGGVQIHLEEISQRIQSTDSSFQMPPPGNAGLTTEEKSALLTWIAAGAPEIPGQAPKPVTPPPDSGPPELNFASVSAHVLQPRCIQCHDTDFDTFDHTKPLIAEISFRIHAFGTDKQMPPANKTQLTPDELKLLDDWIAAGAPET
jgi:uncharacterized membrane protein